MRDTALDRRKRLFGLAYVANLALKLVHEAPRLCQVVGEPLWRIGRPRRDTQSAA